jgi:hypothetical protein
VSDQDVARHGRRRRKHQGCIGCGESHRKRRVPLLSASSTVGREARSLPTRTQIPSSGSAGSHLLVPAVRVSPARRARPSQARPSRRPWTRTRSHPGRGLTGRAPCYDCERPCRSSAWSRPKPLLLAAAGVTRMGGNRVSGFRRAAAFGRAIARDPSPQGEGAAQIREERCQGQSDTVP